jgi:hypothetical protein
VPGDPKGKTTDEFRPPGQFQPPGDTTGKTTDEFRPPGELQLPGNTTDKFRPPGEFQPPGDTTGKTTTGEFRPLSDTTGELWPPETCQTRLGKCTFALNIHLICLCLIVLWLPIAHRVVKNMLIVRVQIWPRNCCRTLCSVFLHVQIWPLNRFPMLRLEVI